MGKSGTKSYLKCRRLTQEGSKEKNFSRLPGYLSCDILVNKKWLLFALVKKSA